MRERGGLMKKNWFQILSLALNVVLLIALLMTRTELADTQNNLKNQLDSVAWRLSDMDDRITNLSVRQREQTEDLSDFSFEPTGLDPESHTLQADMSITLRRWTADTEVALAVTRNGQTTAWDDAPEATVAADGTVSWPVMSNDDTLEDGVTYTVSFNVKPTQAAFDEAVKNHKDDANASGDNNFYTNDNSSATVDYKTVVTSSQGGTTTSDPQTAAYLQKPTITLPVSKITVTKTWSDDNENHANDSVQVQLKQDGEDYANGSATLNAAGNWTHEFTVPAGPEGHTYSVSEVKVEGYDSKVDKTDLKLQGLTAQSGAFTVTNTPSYVTLPASDVKVTKVVQGHAANSDFGFNLKCVDSTDANAGKCADVTGLANNGLTTTVSKDELTASGASATVGFGNGDLKFRVPTGADNLVYTFEASEDTEKPAAGWKYDNDKVTVKVTVSRTDAVVSYEYGENDSDRTNTESAQFTNKYVAISSLPLTGGTTGRDWMVFGGGLGLLALLAAAGYTVWRKRQLV